MNPALRLSALAVTIALGSVSGAGQAAAAVPTQTAIEGVLLSSGGGPAADGNYTVTVGIYSAESGGNPVWAESGVTIAAKGGQFSYQLGAKTPLSATALSLSSAWVGIQIGSDPELPRKPLGAAPFALRAAVAEALECSGCLKAGNLDAGILQPYAKSADLGSYAKTADLSAYAKTSDLGAYAKTADLSNYAKTADLADYVKAASLAKVAGTGSFNDLKDLPTLHKVATTGSYADLTNKPVMAKIDAACGTNLVLKGIKADGSYECASAGIAPDMINEISNDLIWNQFVDSKAGAPDVQIKDGFSAGVTDTLSFPDVGLAEKIWVNFSGLNSDMSKVIVELYGPGMGSPYILFNGGKTGTALTAKYNDGDALVSGDMNKDWLGKNIKGNWSITVKDIAAIQVPPGTNPFTYDGKFNWSVHIQTLSSKKIQIKGDLLVDGSVKIGADSATCDSTKAGALRYVGGNLELCNGSVWAAWFGTAGFPNSTIVTPAYAAMINGWVGNPFKTWKLCYRKSTDQGDSGTFHSKCNGKGDTVTVATLDSGKVIGGYAGCSWYSKQTYNYQCGGSFLFSLTNGHKYNKRTYHIGDSASFSYNYWIHDHSSHGPTWGGGHDWHVSTNMTTGYCNLGHDYTCRVGTDNGYSGYGSAACRDDFCGNYDSWKIKELEVWASL